MEASEWQTIRYVVEDGVATLTLNRPAQKNALDAVMRSELTANSMTRPMSGGVGWFSR